MENAKTKLVYDLNQEQFKYEKAKEECQNIYESVTQVQSNHR